MYNTLSIIQGKEIHRIIIGCQKYIFYKICIVVFQLPSQFSKMCYISERRKKPIDVVIRFFWKVPSRQNG